MRFVTTIFCLAAVAGTSLGAAIDSKGINSEVTGLDGSGVLIGQMDRFRPGKAGFDLERVPK